MGENISLFLDVFVMASMLVFLLWFAFVASRAVDADDEEEFVFFS